MLAATLDKPTETVEIFANQGTTEKPGCVTLWRRYLQDNPDLSVNIYSDSSNAIANAKAPPGWLQEALRHVRTAFHFFKQFI